MWASATIGLQACTTINIVQPRTVVAERTIAEWGEAWWQWLLATPPVHDPALDQTGEKCQYGQSGPVWFLAGSYTNDKVTRRCTVPEGKYVLFPIANGLYKPRPLSDANCDSSQEHARTAIDAVLAPYATVDGRQLPRIQGHRERTGACFDPAQTGRKVSAADGYWVMLGPLGVGEHVFKFGNDEQGPARKDTTVLLTVARDVQPAVYAPWPSADGPGGVRERPKPGGGTDVSWNAFGAVMPLTPHFDARAVMRRVAALVARDRRYMVVRTKTKPHDSEIWLAVSPRDVAEFDRRSPGVAKQFHSPVWIWADAPERGKVRFVASNLVMHGAEQSIGVQASRDIQRFLFQALDKKVAVSDHEIKAAFSETWPEWEKLIQHRPPKPAPTAAERAATQAYLQAHRVKMARASEATQPSPGRVHLRGQYVGAARISPDGMTIEWCCTGGFTIAKATRTYSYGKYYFEVQLKRAPRRSSNATYTNVGVMYGDEHPFADDDAQAFRHGAKGPADGAIVGVALDLDSRRLYVNVNGIWDPGPPRAGDGKPLKNAPSYTAVFSVDSPESDTDASDSWTVNFGAQPFRLGLPAGYRAYDPLEP